MANVSEALYDWSNTGGSNQPDSGDQATVQADLQAIQAGVRGWLAHKGSDIASVAGTTDIGAVEGLFHDITGAEVITGFGTVSAGIWKFLKFEGAATLTHNSTSLILLGGATRVMAAGDVGIYISEGSGNWRELAYFAAGNGASKVLAAQQATTSGTTKDFTIPAWAKKVTVMLNGVSWDGTEELIVQLGDSGGIEDSGYTGDIATAAGTIVAMSSGFLCVNSGSATQVMSGAIVLTLLNAAAFTWVASVSTVDTATPGVFNGAGVKALSAALTTVRLTTSGTPDDFDAGAVSVLIE